MQPLDEGAGAGQGTAARHQDAVRVQEENGVEFDQRLGRDLGDLGHEFTITAS